MSIRDNILKLPSLHPDVLFMGIMEIAIYIIRESLDTIKNGCQSELFTVKHLKVRVNRDIELKYVYIKMNLMQFIQWIFFNN